MILAEVVGISSKPVTAKQERSQSMNQETERVSILKEVEDSRKRIEAKQERILADLAILKGRG